MPKKKERNKKNNYAIFYVYTYYRSGHDISRREENKEKIRGQSCYLYVHMYKILVTLYMYLHKKKVTSFENWVIVT